MSFLEKVPVYISDLEHEIHDLSMNRLDINWGHDCDCEYCDRSGEEADPEADEKAEQIDKDIHERKRMIERLKRYQILMTGTELD